MPDGEAQTLVVDLVAVFIAAIAVLVTILSAIASLVWLWLRSRWENTLLIITRLESEEMLKHRHDVDALARAHGGLIDWTKIERDTNARITCSIVCKLFGQIGYMARHRQIKRNVVLAGWSRHIITNYERLLDYLQERDKLDGGMGFFDDFTWLYFEAKQYDLARKRKTSLRGHASI